MYCTYPPVVSLPAATWWAPIHIINAPTTPSTAVEASDISDCAVNEEITFASSLATPAANTFASLASAWYPFTTRTPPSDSVSLPVTSALIFERSRKIGRIVLKARCRISPNTTTIANVSHCHRRAQPNQNHKRKQRRQQPAKEVHHARTDQVAHAFHIRHDARHQRTRAVLVEERNRQPTDMCLYLFAQLRDQFLPGFRKQLRQRIRRSALQQRSRHHHAYDLRQQRQVMFVHHPIDQNSDRPGEHQPARAVHDHQQKAERKQPPARLDQLPHIRPDLFQRRLRPRLRQFSRGGLARTAHRPVA